MAVHNKCHQRRAKRQNCTPAGTACLDKQDSVTQVSRLFSEDNNPGRRVAEGKQLSADREQLLRGYTSLHRWWTSQRLIHQMHLQPS